MNILVINGPNINMLGKREPDKYGQISFYELEELVKEQAEKYDIDIDFFQSNSEGDIVDCIQKSAGYDGIILNAGAYTHTSIAIRDALLSINAKFIEVHLSNVFAREPFRHHSYLSDIALGVIAGFREDSYLMAVDYFANGVWQ